MKLCDGLSPELRQIRYKSNTLTHHLSMHVSTFIICLTDTIVLNMVMSPRLRVARFTSSLWQLCDLNEVCLE